MNETVDQQTIAINGRWYGHAMRKEDGHIMGWGSLVQEFQCTGEEKANGHEGSRMKEKARRLVCVRKICPLPISELLGLI